MSANKNTRLHKPRLVLPQTEPIPGTTPDYARGFRLGAISVRRDLANECRRRACDADRYGNDGEAIKYHQIADQAEAEIERLSKEIGEIR